MQGFHDYFAGEGHVDRNMVAEFSTAIAVVAALVSSNINDFQHSQALEITNFVGFLFVMLSSMSDHLHLQINCR